jgi:hypothetical protein
MKKQLQEENMAFLRENSLANEKARRETSRQNLVTAINMFGNQFASAFQNPQLMMKAIYYAVLVYGAFQVTRLSLAITAQLFMSKLSKPQLVRETSKLYSNNYVTLPFVWMRKRFMMSMKRTEKDLLQGVILDKKLED